MLQGERADSNTSHVHTARTEPVGPCWCSQSTHTATADLIQLVKPPDNRGFTQNQEQAAQSTVPFRMFEEIHQVIESMLRS